MNDCEHDWQPLLRWSGRYRCERCHALAYRRIILPSCAAGGPSKEGAPNEKRAAEMVVYLCRKRGKGQECGEPAVTHGKTQLCAAHANERGKR